MLFEGLVPITKTQTCEQSIIWRSRIYFMSLAVCMACVSSEAHRAFNVLKSFSIRASSCFRSAWRTFLASSNSFWSFSLLDATSISAMNGLQAGSPMVALIENLYQTAFRHLTLSVLEGKRHQRTRLFKLGTAAPHKEPMEVQLARHTCARRAQNEARHTSPANPA